MSEYILTLDIGGTNPSIAIVHKKEADFLISYTEFFPKNQHSLLLIINDFLARMSEDDITTNKCCICVAGYIKDNSCLKPTHAEFRVDSSEILNNTALEEVFVINDFEAIAYSLLNQGTESPVLKQITNYDVSSINQKSILGPGTGLGVAFIQNGSVIASEGGHVSFKPTISLESYETFLRDEKGVSHIDMETYVSGFGLSYLVEFFLSRGAELEKSISQRPYLQSALQKHNLSFRTDNQADTKLLEKEVLENSDLLPQTVSQLAFKHTISHCIMQLFFEYLGQASRNVALMMSQTDCVVIAGGIVQKNAVFFKEKSFTEGMLWHQNQDIAGFIEKKPVFVLTDYSMSHIGCAQAFFQKNVQ